MRILHVTRELGGDRRFGIGRSLDPVVGALRHAGHEVSYLTQDELGDAARAWQRRWLPRAQSLWRTLFGPQGEAFAAIWIERLNMGRLAAKVAAREGADAVHLHDPWIGWGYRLARRAHGARARWGITEHGFGSYTDATREEGVPYTPALLRLHRRLEATLLAAADWVVCPTRSGCVQLARDLALPDLPTHWHPVPHARPALVLPTRVAARQALGWPAEPWQVLAIGRLNPVKRFDALLRAFDQPFGVDGKLYRVDVSIGYALAPQDDNNLIDLLKRAEAGSRAGRQSGMTCLRRGGASAALSGN